MVRQQMGTAAVSAVGDAATVPRFREPRGSLVRRALYAVSAVDPQIVAATQVAVIAVFGVLGIVHNADLSIWNLDREAVPPAYWSAFLLEAAAALTLLYAFVGADSAVRPYHFVFLGLLFGFMGLDEWRGIHERLQAATGVNWLLLYVPIVVPAGVAWLKAVRTLVERHRAAAWLLMAGAAAWCTAQAFEAYQWDGGVHVGRNLLHPNTIPPEEILEMAGSAMFGLALLLMIRRAARPASGRRWIQHQLACSTRAHETSG